MTETTAVSHGTPSDRPKRGSFGVPFPMLKPPLLNHEGTEFFLLGKWVK